VPLIAFSSDELYSLICDVLQVIDSLYMYVLLAFLLFMCLLRACVCVCVCVCACVCASMDNSCLIQINEQILKLPKKTRKPLEIPLEDILVEKQKC